MTNERHEKALEAAVHAGIAKVWSIDGEAPLDDGRRQIAVSIIAAYLQAMDSVIVPKKPSPEMMRIGADATPMWDTGKADVYAIAVNDVADIYLAMLSKAPNHFTNGE